MTKLTKARNPSYKMVFDFKEEKTRTSCGQYVNNYAISELKQKQITCITNFKARRIAGVKSEALTLGFPDREGSHQAICIGPVKQVRNGSLLNFIGPMFEQEVDFSNFLNLEIRAGTIESIEKTEDYCFAIVNLGDMGKCAAFVPGRVEGLKSYIGEQVPVLINLKSIKFRENNTFSTILFVVPLPDAKEVYFNETDQSITMIKEPATIITVTKPVKNGLELF